MCNSDRIYVIGLKAENGQYHESIMRTIEELLELFRYWLGSSGLPLTGCGRL
jgi:hypothetical protein